MKQKKIFCKRLLTLVLSLAMVFTSVNVPTMTVQAAQTDIDESIVTPFGYEGTAYNSATDTINVSWGYNPDTMASLDACVTITCAETGYEKAHTGLAVNMNHSLSYGEEGSTWEAGKTYQVEIQFKDTTTGKYSKAITWNVSIPTEATAPNAVNPDTIAVAYWDGETNKGKIRVAWAPSNGATSYEVSIDDSVLGTATGGEYFAENNYTAGLHTVSIVAINDEGRSEAATKTFTLTEEQAGVSSSTVADEAYKATLKALWETESAIVEAGNEDGKYTDDSWATYKAAVDAAKAVLDDATKTTAEVDAALVALQNAKAGLKEVSAETAGTAVNFATLEANGDLEVYFGTDWSGAAGSHTVDGTNVTINLTNIGWNGEWGAQLNLYNHIFKANEIYNVSFDIESSIDKNIVFKVTPKANSGEILIQETLDLTASKSQSVSFDFTKAMTEDTNGWVSFGLGQNGDDVANSAATIKISNLKIYSATSGDAIEADSETATEADKAELQALYDEAKAESNEDGTYTDDSWAAYQEAIAAAKTVLEGTVSVAQVNNAYDALVAAKEGLRLNVVDTDVDATYILFDRIEHRDAVDAGAPVEVDYVGTTATITGSDWGNEWGPDSKYQVMLKNIIPVTANDGYQIGFKVTSEVSRSILVKVCDAETENVIYKEETIPLEAGVPYIYSAHTDKDVNVEKLMVLFALGDQTANTQNTIIIDKLSLLGDESGYVDVTPYINLEMIEHKDAVDAGAPVEVTYAKTAATITGSDWGNDWGNDSKYQVMLKNIIPVTANDGYQIGFEVTSEVSRSILVKVCDAETEGVIYKEETIPLEAGVPYIYSAHTDKDVNVEKLMVLFALGDQTANTQNTITIDKLSLLGDESGYIVITEPVQVDKDAPAVTPAKVSDKQNGYRIGEDVVLKYSAEEAQWGDAITAVVLNNKTLKATDYTIDSQNCKITFNSDLFTQYNVYSFAFEADGYHDTALTVPVYDTSVDDEVWEQEWADEFNGTKLDTTKWDYEIGIQSGTDGASDAPTYWGNEERQYYIKEAAKVTGGKLVITADAITDKIREKYNITDDKVQYTSARIRTVSEDGSNTMYGTTYGRIEAKMELPHADGYWPAFWMLPTNETIEKYGTWATSGELDIMEAVGQNDNRVNGTIHYGSTWPGNVYSGGSYYFPEGENIEGAHVYAVEWEPGEIRWYVDDVLYHVENNWYAKAAGAAENYAFPAPYDEDFYILFNLAMSGNYVSNVMPTEMGKSMKVDYVRVYKDANMDYTDENVEVGTPDKDVEFYKTYKVNADESGNYIKDPNFEAFDTSAATVERDGAAVVPQLGCWDAAINTGAWAAGTVSVEERDEVKYAKVDVTALGSANYNVQLMQHVPLATGYTYKLTFDAYTDKVGGRNFTVAAKGDADNGWVAYDSGITANLTNKVQSYEYTFTMKAASDPTARIEMNLGNDTGAVCVGNVKLVMLSDEVVAEDEAAKLYGPKEPLANGEHIYNGTFDLGTGKFAYWLTEGDYSVSTANRTMLATFEDTADAVLKQVGIQLLPGDSYKLTLDASASEETEITYGLYAANGLAYAEKTETIGTETTALDLEFAMSSRAEKVEDAVFMVSFGGAEGSWVEIDNISMMRTSDNNTEWEPYMLYPLGGETVTDYVYYVNDVPTSKKAVDGVITEEMKGVAPTKDGVDQSYQYMIYSDVVIENGKTYTLSYDIKTSVPGQKITVSVQQDQTWTTLFSEDIKTTDKYVPYTTDTFTATTSGAMKLKFILGAPDNTSCEVSIRNVKMTVEGAPYLEVSKNMPTELVEGTKIRLDVVHAVEVGPAYETLSYESSNEAAATIDEDGIITALAEGKTTITVTSLTGAVTSFELTVVAKSGDVSGGDIEGAYTDVAKLADDIAAATEGVEEEDTYTVPSYEDYADALAAVNKIKADIEGGVVYTEDAVAEALAKLEAAVAELEKCLTNATLAAMKAALAANETNISNASSYMTQSFEAFKKAYDVVDSLVTEADGNPSYISEKDATNALELLKSASNGLEKKVTAETGMRLATVIYGLSDKVENSHLYTPASYAVFEKAYNKAVSLLNESSSGEVSEAKLIAAVQDLQDAVAQLKEKEGLWFETIEDQTYTGKKITPAVVVWDGTEKLVEGEDYKISYKNNTNVGIAKVTVTGKGNYNKNATTTFEIVPKSLKDDDVEIADVSVQINTKGKITNPKVVVKYNGKTLKLNTDYTVTYPSKLNVKAPVAGDYKIVVTAKGKNFTGKETINYTVLAKEMVNMSNVDVTLSAKSVAYGDINRPEVTVTYGKGDNKVTLEKDTHYTVEYIDDVIGKNKASVVVTAIDDENNLYYGSKTVKYTVTGTAFNSKTITVSGCDTNYAYTGYEVKVADYDEDFAVYEKTKDVSGNDILVELVEDEDYIVTYKNATNAAGNNKAQVIVTGLGKYNGSVTKKFTIDKVDLADEMKKLENREDSLLTWVLAGGAEYTKDGAKAGYTLEYNGLPLTSKDYKVTYSKNNAVGNTATIKITGKGNFKGSFEDTFRVVAPANDMINVEASDVKAPAKANKLKPSVKVTEEGSNKVLKAGTDYTTEMFVYDVSGGDAGEIIERPVDDADLKVVDQKVYVRVTLINNYASEEDTNEFIKEFRLFTKSMTGVVVSTIPAQDYDRTAKTPEFKLYANKNDMKDDVALVEGTHYEIVEWKNNTNAGTASVVVKGIGEGYGGTKTIKFKINPEKMTWAEEALGAISNFFTNLFN